MVMKDKLKKHNRKGKKASIKKIAIISSTAVALICAIAIPTYILSNGKDENQGIAQVEETSDSTLEEEDLTSIVEEEQVSE